ncbi:unnamed protein product [marine sediment metagenome]|uniref:Uncharacterized protein n=1 Tax=marine sediment metagenome TaxID=412755 RepID=X1NM98_9ZZZZ
MTNYTINIAQPIIIGTKVTTKVIRSPLIWKVLLPWVLGFLLGVFIFQHFFIKILEEWALEKKINRRYVYITLLTLLILILMVMFAVTYGPIDLLRPISSSFGIES